MEDGFFFWAFGHARRSVVPRTTALVHKPSPLTECSDFVSISIRAADYEEGREEEWVDSDYEEGLEPEYEEGMEVEPEYIEPDYDGE